MSWIQSASEEISTVAEQTAVIERVAEPAAAASARLEAEVPVLALE